MTVRVGKTAPEFETKGYLQGEIKSVKLADYRGKWVMLYFYPGDFTFVCPTDLTAVAAKYEEIKSLGAEVLAPAVGRSVAEMIRQIRACQYVQTHEGEATPAGWEPGKLTLKPGEDLVGKVCQIWAPEWLFNFRSFGEELRATALTLPAAAPPAPGCYFCGSAPSAEEPAR